MASDVDICNLSLGRLGDGAEVTSIFPPDGSSQARYCKMFYPMARDSFLQMHPWIFSAWREALTPVAVPVAAPQWQYAYSQPANTLEVIAIYDPAAPDDIVFPIPQYHNAGTGFAGDTTGVALLTPQNFVVESDGSGNQIILTNQQNAIALVNHRIVDTSKFSPLFTDGLAWLLASYLAGPIIKGEVGVEMGQSCLKAFVGMKGVAATLDSNQRRLNPTQSTIASWMANR